MNSDDMIRYLRQKASGLQDELNNLITEREAKDRRINQVERLLAAVEELLREEMGKRGMTVGEEETRPLDRLRFADMSLKAAVHMIIEEAEQPLHVDEVLRRLRAGGARLKAKKPKLSVAATLHRDKETYTRVAPNTFALRSEEDDLIQDEIPF